MQLVEVKVVKNKHTQWQGCDVTEQIIQKQINDQWLCSQAIKTHVAYLPQLKAYLYLTHENPCYVFTSLAVWKLE